MKVAIVSLQERFGQTYGDCLQAEKTVSALCALGVSAARFYFDPATGNVFDATNKLLGPWAEALADKDIVHAIPPIPFGNIKRLPKIRAKLVVSTVFWCSATYWKVLLRNQPHLDWEFAKLVVRELLGRIGIRLLTNYDGYDLLLPNSEAEAANVRKYCRLRPNVKIVPVPNGIDPIPDFVADLPRSDRVPKGDYVLVPGCFEPRKNQVALIRALADFPHPIVFMGTGRSLETCRRIASPSMTFLGLIPHCSREFYALFKYARVVCLPSNCETPSIAAIEGAALGARPVVPEEGGTLEYYGEDAEYLNPLMETSIAAAVKLAWKRGRLAEARLAHYKSLTWAVVAEKTNEAYKKEFHI